MILIQNKSQLFHNEWPEEPLLLSFQALQKNRPTLQFISNVDIVNKNWLWKMMRRGLKKVFEKVPLKFGPKIVKKRKKSWFFGFFTKSAKTPVLACFDTFLPLKLDKIEFSGMVCWHKLEGLRVLRGRLHIKSEPIFQPKNHLFSYIWAKKAKIT